MKYIEGNLLDTHSQIIVHGCNAQGVMGSGVAKLIRDKYPKAFSIYKDVYSRQGLNPGEINFTYTGGKYIVNAITQENYGRDSGVIYVSYDAVRKCMREVNILARQTGSDTVAMPKIGAGLAKGDWNIISGIIKQEITYAIPLIYFI